MELWSGLLSTDTVMWRWKCRIVECEVWSRGLILSFYIPLPGPGPGTGPQPAQLQLHPHTLTQAEIGHTQPRIWFPVTQWLTPGPGVMQRYSLIHWTPHQPRLQPYQFDVFSILTKVCQKLYDQTSLYYLMSSFCWYLLNTQKLPGRRQTIDLNLMLYVELRHGL